MVSEWSLKTGFFNSCAENFARRGFWVARVGTGQTSDG